MDIMGTLQRYFILERSQESGITTSAKWVLRIDIDAFKRLHQVLKGCSSGFSHMATAFDDTQDPIGRAAFTVADNIKNMSLMMPKRAEN